MFFTLILRNLHLKHNSTCKELSIASSITKFTFLTHWELLQVCVMKFSLLRKRLQMMNLNLSRLKINLVITKGENEVIRVETLLKLHLSKGM